MEAVYKFIDFEDIIHGTPMNKHKFESFKVELGAINRPFKFNIYIYGSYVGYLQNRTEYDDVNFLILGKKIMEIEILSQFLLLFHSLAQRYNLIYDISYGTNLNIKNIDFSGKMFNIIKGDVQLLRSYKNIILNNKPKFGKDLLRFEKSNLFQQFINSGVVNEKVIMNSTNRTKFNIPIKII